MDKHQLDTSVYLNDVVGFVRVIHISHDPLGFKYTGIDEHGKIYYFDEESE